MGRFWWFAFSCFLLAGALAVTGVYIADSIPALASAWLYVIALSLIGPMAWWGVLYFTGQVKIRDDA